MWLIRRGLTSLFLVWALATVVFLAIHMVPGDPAETLLSQGGAAPSPEAVARLRETLGLDRPLPVQYGDFLRGLVRGDLGRSLVDRVPVADEVMRRLPRTLELVCAAALIAFALGLPAGMVSALHQDRPGDHALRLTSSVLVSVPVFVVGTLLLLVFAQMLRLVPTGGFVRLSDDPVTHLKLMALPALTISLALTASVYRISRSTILTVMANDYVKVARAKGMRQGRILRLFVLRNAIAPIITVTALEIGTLLGGTVLVEYVFNWPGLSGLMVEAVNARDYPMVVGVVLTIGTIFILINLLVDVLYAVLDPKVTLA